MADITPERTDWLRRLGGLTAPIPPVDERPDWAAIAAGVLVVAGIVYLVVVP